MEIRTFFQKSFGFSDEMLDQLDRSGYFDSVEIVDYKKKKQILREGDSIDAIYFLIKGVVRWYFLDKEGNEHTDRLIYQFGESTVPRSYYHDFVSQVDIQAITDVQMIRVPRLSFECMMEQYPEMLRLSIKLLTDSFFDQWKYRVKILPQSTMDRYKWFTETHGALIGRISNKYIASYLSMTPSTLSRVQKRYREIQMQESI